MLTETSALQNDLAIYAANQGLPFLDLTDPLRQASLRAELVYSLDGHFNPEGHRVVAKIIADWIVKDQVFPIE